MSKKDKAEAKQIEAAVKQQLNDLDLRNSLRRMDPIQLKIELRMNPVVQQDLDLVIQQGNARIAEATFRTRTIEAMYTEALIEG